MRVLSPEERGRAEYLYQSGEMTLGEIAKALDCTTYDLSPWLYSPAKALERIEAAIERWPDTEWDLRRGQVLRGHMYRSICDLNKIEFDWPTTPLVPGNDYVDAKGYCIKTAGITASS